LPASPSSSPRQGQLRKRFLFRFYRNHALLPLSRLGKRGVSRSSRAWRRDAVGASGCGVIYHADERSGAHGEIVWSWRPGADAERIAHRALS
jgi:hypothetical protein